MYKCCATSLVLLHIALLSGCTTPTLRHDWSNYTGPGAEHFHKEEYELPLFGDPLEPANRVVWAVNNALVLCVVDPLSTVWRFFVPEPFREHLNLAARNITFPIRGVNNLLQGNCEGARNETWRFLINSTVGVLGLYDPATVKYGIEGSDENLGRTLVRWGWRKSTYLMLPLLGASTTRDTVGLVGDYFLDPASYFFPAGPIKGFIVGSEHIDSYKTLLQTHPDPYQLRQWYWLARRWITAEQVAEPLPPAGAVQTLGALRLRPTDPWFVYNAHTHRVIIPSTGRKLPYDVWMQRGDAPLVFVVGGMSAHRRSTSTVALAELCYREGFSVVTVSNPMNFEFMRDAASVDVPGFAPADCRDLHVALDAIYHDVRRHYGNSRVTACALLGSSLGGFHALYIAAGISDPDDQLVDFERFVCLYPPVRIAHAITELDRMYNLPLAFAPDLRDEWAQHTLHKAVGSERVWQTREPSDVHFGEDEAEFLIGVNYRLALHDVIRVSQYRHNMGVLRTPLSKWSRTASAREILEYSFSEYFYAFVLPYYVEHEQYTVDERELFELNNLRSLGDLLHLLNNVYIIGSQNDFLLAPGDVEWLTELLGADQVTYFPDGGHEGNLYEPEVQATVMNCLRDLLPAVAGK